MILKIIVDSKVIVKNYKVKQILQHFECDDIVEIYPHLRF